jgi:putative transposase
MVTQLCQEHGLSQWRASRLVGIDHSALRYQAPRADDQLRRRLRELAGLRRRFGYRRLGCLLTREGCRLNHKKLHRLYREEKLRMRRRAGRKRALGTRAPLLLPAGRVVRELERLTDQRATPGCSQRQRTK